ncbi:hypothetical protein PC9H_005868 [Pleurotus ostreatus]|uniref:Uncharacterized protein n=1 Tax=Pleurotus ostreatus TaxID=5322 RepID=A0A8H6ZVW5_PLEOS|nr:uncharacterized protein PC9H_005868 [Pleurotus ostreatus]KAF7430168.1 hypothetical protein PC9H_005868 [Pleurotus ostreatus]
MAQLYLPPSRLQLVCSLRAMTPQGERVRLRLMGVGGSDLFGDAIELAGARPSFQRRPRTRFGAGTRAPFLRPNPRPRNNGIGHAEARRAQCFDSRRELGAQGEDGARTTREFYKTDTKLGGAGVRPATVEKVTSPTSAAPAFFHMRDTFSPPLLRKSPSTHGRAGSILFDAKDTLRSGASDVVETPRCS